MTKGTTNMRMTRLKDPIRWWTSLLILLPVTLHCATITWGPATDISGDGDVINPGTLAYAYDFTSPATVNGVSFNALPLIDSGTNIYAPGFNYTDSVDFTSGANPFAALSSAYKIIITAAAYSVGGASPPIVPVSLEHLSIGHEYAVQVWVDDPRGPENARSETITSPGGNTNTLRFSTNTLTNPGGLGQFTVGTFTADATNQMFTLMGDLTNFVTELNALQVRDLGVQALPAWNGINLAGAGAIKLVFTGPSGSNYIILTSTNISIPITNWTPLPNGSGTFSGSPITNIDSTATNKARFYRIRLP
jgi:hypothetical protein